MKNYNPLQPNSVATMCEKHKIRYRCRHTVTEEMKYCSLHQTNPLNLNRFMNCANDKLVFTLNMKEDCAHCEYRALAQKATRETKEVFHYPAWKPPKPFHYYQSYVHPHIEAAKEELEKEEEDLYKEAREEVKTTNEWVLVMREKKAEKKEEKK